MIRPRECEHKEALVPAQVLVQGADEPRLRGAVVELLAAVIAHLRGGVGRMRKTEAHRGGMVDP